MTLPRELKKPNNGEPPIDRMRDIEHKRWLIGQIQYLFQTISESRETDKLDIENRAEQYKSSMFGTRDKILAGVAFFATILLGLASIYTNELKNSLLLLLSIDIGIGIAAYIITEIITYKGPIAFTKIKAAHYIPITKLSFLDDLLVNLSFDLDRIKISHLKNFFNYVKLISMSKFELIDEYENASQLRSLFQQKHYFNLLKQNEERLKNQACIFYRINKGEFLEDEQIISYDIGLARTFGGVPLLQKYDELINSYTVQVINKPEYGLTIEFPPDWQIGPAKKKGENIENVIVAACPSYPFDTDVSLKVATYFKPDQLLEEVVKSELDYKSSIESDTDTILTSESTQVGRHNGHKIVYNVKYKSLVDKVMKIWFSANNTVYEIAYEAPNPQKYDAYLADATKIIDSIKI